jgi:membrane-anchored protein YejM (alkaline phosphatase superfamily)
MALSISNSFELSTSLEAVATKFTLENVNVIHHAHRAINFNELANDEWDDYCQFTMALQVPHYRFVAPRVPALDALAARLCGKTYVNMLSSM